MEILERYYQQYVLNKTDINEEFSELYWKYCTRYLIGFFIKVGLLKEWKKYDKKGKLFEYWDLRCITSQVWRRFELEDNSGEILHYIEQQMEQERDHYSDESLMDCISEGLISEGMDPDILECINIANDLFIGRRNSYEMYDQEYLTEKEYAPSMGWPFVRWGPPYGKRPYLQGQDPARSNALIWVPLPILRFAFFAKEVARFGRPFEGMQAVAQEQLEGLDFTLIHPEYRLILRKVLELEDTKESRSSLDILSNNLFLGEKPLTQAWVEGPEELPWIR